MRELENDPDLLKAFGHLRIALADQQMRQEVLRALEVFVQTAKNKK